MYFEDVGDLACKKCEKVTNAQNMLICDYCANATHTTCLNPSLKQVPEDAWYCEDCMTKIVNFERKDITIDFLVIEYLKNKILPNDEKERKRVVKRAINYSYRKGKIYRITS